MSTIDRVVETHQRSAEVTLNREVVVAVAPTPPVPTVAILTRPGVLPLEVAAVAHLLSFNSEVGPLYSVRLCAAKPGWVRSTGSFTLYANAGPAALSTAHTVVIPGTYDLSEPTPAPVLAALAEVANRGARLVGIGSGVFVLAEAGLLRGRRATTHWEHLDALRRRHRDVRVDQDRLFVRDGHLYTSAGLASGLDLLIELIAVDHGVFRATQVARHAVVAAPRPGEHPQVLDRPVPVAAKPGLADIRRWMLEHLDAPVSVDDLARRAFMSRRQFTRVFRAETGTSVMKWITAQRLIEAQRLLESTDLPVEHIGRICGFATSASFRACFRSSAGTTPSLYRRRARGAGRDPLGVPPAMTSVQF